MAISDWFKRAPASPTKSIGATGSDDVTVSGGEFFYQRRDLGVIGPRKWDTYNLMMQDVAIIATGVRLILNLVANAVWTCNPPEDLSDNEDAVAQGYADEAYKIIFNMRSPWSKVIRKLAMGRFLGFSLLEWTAVKRDDGTIGFLDIAHRPQRTIVKWNRDSDGEIVSVEQQVSGRGRAIIPREKLVYFVDDVFTDAPEGTGLLRHIAETAARLWEYADLQDTGFRTDLRGIPVSYAPLGELQQDVKNAGPAGSDAYNLAKARKDRILEPQRQFIEKHIRNDATGFLLPSDTYISTGSDSQSATSVKKWSVELLTGDSQSFADMAKAVQELKQEVARLFGVEHLLLGADGSGSLALAKTKVGTFFQTVSSLLLDLAEVGDKDILGPLAELNGWPEELRPKLGVNEISDTDIAAVVDAFAKLSQAGAPLMPDDPAVGELYDELGYTRPPERTPEEMLSLNPNRGKPVDPNAPQPDPAMSKRKRLATKRRSRRRGSY